MPLAGEQRLAQGAQACAFFQRHLQVTGQIDGSLSVL
jgi:hypothetical protein